MQNIFKEIPNKELESINGGSILSLFVSFPDPIEQYEAIADGFDPNSPKHQVIYKNYIKAITNPWAHKTNTNTTMFGGLLGGSGIAP